MNSTTQHSLKHHFLIAMPQMDDPNFAQTLIYLVDHNEFGAMGLVVNRTSGLTLAQILDQLQPDIRADARCQTRPIYAGGPVQTDRGFVLHPRGWQFHATLELGELALSTSQDSLVAIAEGHGPEQCLIALGYAGWDAGQLEAELLDNAWLTCPADPAILFEVASEERLARAATSLGVDLALLAREAGHA
ncbi:YqgE/AlgH family protein [Geopseudomonas guangdongensis]|uniref:UPF0301 protein SAMN05216580_0830 n=1 Tax=Geopseudomonas guangdongensis TaxID=1245526 RepID=A0A1H2ETH8_9GAMM|nr:YqgE/AlgH family protein [Pseudomonas guangdongensis]SDT98472.1 putative transcriptional regulator [Pseudomonas guangdongensis]